MEDSNSQYALRRASPPTASRHAQAPATDSPISALAVPSRWERERYPRLRRGAGAGTVGVVPKWRSAAIASPLPPSGAGARAAVGSGTEAGGLPGQRENGAHPERGGLPAAARQDRGGALQSHRACERLGAAGLDLDRSDGRGESGGDQAAEGDTQLPRGFLKGGGEGPGSHLMCVTDLGPQGGRHLCLLVAERQSCCRTTLRSVSTLVVPYNECLA
ncbi:hypothetical protein Nmel_000729 [Mimus melanotis]